KNDESTNDFAPTDPGNSPGIGHPPRLSDDFKVVKVLKKNDESTNDFAPTDPGNSPGIGHPPRLSDDFKVVK
ncbi:unnamed protein product, partial [Eruca vesicaria subsp. sativa]|nr:unnamed protein product [Eruca vesicaria subsp. sativa]